MVCLEIIKSGYKQAAVYYKWIITTMYYLLTSRFFLADTA